MSYFTHPLSGGAAAPTAGLGERQPLIAVLGRVLAVANAPGAPVVDFYDAGRAADVSAALGPGHAKLRYLSSFPVVDVHAPVAITALAMLPSRSGLLAVAGESRLGMGALERLRAARRRRAVFAPVRDVASRALDCRTQPVARPPRAAILVYRVGVSAVGLPMPLRSAAAVDASDDIAIEMLPSLVFRASLPGISHAQLLPHPVLLGVLGVRLGGDTAIRFYDVGAHDATALDGSDAVDGEFSRDGSVGVALPGPRDAEVGAVITDAADGALVAATMSTDGALLAVASSRRAMTDRRPTRL